MNGFILTNGSNHKIVDISTIPHTITMLICGSWPTDADDCETTLFLTHKGTGLLLARIFVTGSIIYLDEMSARTVSAKAWKKDADSVTKPFIENCQSFIEFLAVNYNLVYVALSVTVGRNLSATLSNITDFYEMPVYQNYTGNIKSFFSNTDISKNNILLTPGTHISLIYTVWTNSFTLSRKRR